MHQVLSARAPVLVMLASGPAVTTVAAQEDRRCPPQRILPTNDNGIDDPALIALARAFARSPETEVYVEAATGDRSGTSNHPGATPGGVVRPRLPVTTERAHLLLARWTRRSAGQPASIAAVGA